MIAAALFIPNPSAEIEDLLSDVWDSGHAKGLLCVKRMSMQGNPCTRGMVISDEEPIQFPVDFESNSLPDELVETAHKRFREEIANQNNGVECSNEQQLIH